MMVCLGNICRSPLAHGLLRDKVDKLDLNIDVYSSGTTDLHKGEAPDSRMQQTALDRGIDISDLRAEHFTSDCFNSYDVIYVMDSSNLKNVLSLATNNNDRQKVKLILNEINPPCDSEVPDPYYGGNEGFVNVFKLLDQATNNIIDKLIQL